MVRLGNRTESFAKMVVGRIFHKVRCGSEGNRIDKTPLQEGYMTIEWLFKSANQVLRVPTTFCIPITGK